MTFWDLLYLFRWTPWDTGITPPEIVQLVEGGRIKPGRAIDLGCGTGTNVIYLAQHGFEPVGVDGSARAIERARKKLRATKVDAPLYVANLLDTAHFPVSGPFDFAMDIGVMHGFDESGRKRYAATLNRLTRQGSYHFTFGFKPGLGRHYFFGPRGLTADDVRRALGPLGFALLEAHDAGIDVQGISHTGWYLSQKQ